MRYPPQASEKFVFTEEDREAFCFRLGALLNGRERLQRLADPNNEASPDTIRINRIELVRQAASFIGDICGDWIKLSELDADSPIDYAVLALQMWQPAIAMHDAHDFFWDDLIDELQRLPFGDEPELLTPAKRPPGSHHQPAKLSFKRLSALIWAGFLKSKAVKPAIFKRDISLAYGADWDAIRKWRQSCARVLGDSFIERRLDRAAQGIGVPDEFPAYHAALFANGAAYRELVGMPKLDFRSYMLTVDGIFED